MAVWNEAKFAGIMNVTKFMFRFMSGIVKPSKDRIIIESIKSILQIKFLNRFMVKLLCYLYLF
jgi:hypothetical protein